MGQIAQNILDAVREAAENGRISCAKAHKLGEELGVPLGVIGAAADELGIKIINCQLGCF
ncbi:MAG: hypothetical protein ACOYI2_00360 [Bacillota bacterium]|nr:hypothetical protein [Clostridia bacterium]